MPNETKLNQIVDRQAIKGDIDFLISQVTTAYDLIKNAPQMYANAKQASGGMSEIKNQTEQLVAAQKKMIETTNNVNTSYDNLSAKQKQDLVQKRLAQQASKEYTNQLKNEAIVNDESAGKIQKIRAQTALLIQERNKLKGTESDYMSQVQKLNKQIDDLNNQEKSLLSTREQAKVNVGAYTSSIVEALKQNQMFAGTWQMMTHEVNVFTGAIKAIGSTVKNTFTSMTKDAGETKGAVKGVGTATEGVATGATKGATAMKILKGAIAATGIGLLVLAVSSLVSWFTKTAEGSSKMKQAFAAVGAIVETLMGVLIKVGKLLVDIVTLDFKDMKKDLQDIGDQFSKIGENAKLAMEIAREELQLIKDKRINMIAEAEITKNIAQERLNAADATRSYKYRMDNLVVSLNGEKKLTEEKIKLIDEETKLTKNKIMLSENEGKKASKEDKDRLAELVAARIGAEQEEFERSKKATKQISNLKKQILEEDNKNAVGFMEARLLKDKEYSEKELTDRIAYLQRKRQAEISEIKFVEGNHAGEIAKINAQYNKEINDAKENFRNKNLNAETEYNNTILQEHIDANNEEIEQDEQSFVKTQNMYARKMQLIKKNIDDEQQIELNNYQKQLIEFKGTDKEMEALKEAHYRKVAEITTKGELDILRISKDAYKNRIEALGLSQTKQETQQIDEYSAKLQKLYDNLKSGKTNVKGFTASKEKLDIEASNKSIGTQIGTLQKQSEEAKKVGDVEAEAGYQKQIAELKKQQIDKGISAEEKAAQRKAELRQKEIELTKKGYEMFFELSNRRIEKEKAENEKRLELIEKQKVKEQDRINTSSLTEAQKTEQTKMLDAQVQQQKEDIDKRNRKLEREKAKNDKEKAIFDIILNTAVGVMGAAPVIPMMILIGAMGAMELALAASQPLPKYEKGSGSNYVNGWAITDEKGAELYINKSGSMYMGGDKPALRHFNEPTQIVPADKVNNYLMNKTLSDLQNPVYSKNNTMDDTGIKKALDKQTAQLSKAFKQKIVILNKNTNNSDWVNSQVKW